LCYLINPGGGLKGAGSQLRGHSRIAPKQNSRISNLKSGGSVNVLSIMNRLLQRCLYLLFLSLAVGIAGPLQAEDGQNPPKIGLVLSGGGARAASHIGILKVFEKEHIPIDCIAGTSFGALVGGLYSIGYSASKIEDILLGQDWNSIFSDAPQRRLTPLIERRDARYQAQISFRGWNPALPTGLLGGQRLTEALDLLTSSQMLRVGYDFDKLPIQFRAVSTNLIDGKAFVFKQGSMTEALRASMAIPMFFTPYEKDGMLLADGGLVDNLPVAIARSMGTDIIIAVNATSPLSTKEDIRTFIDVVDQSISLQMERNVQESLKLATLVLKPGLDRFTSIDYDKLPQIIKRGEEEADSHLEQLKALVAGIPLRPRSSLPGAAAPIIDSISFQGLRQVKSAQLEVNLRVRPGASADPSAISADVKRLYATRLFDSVGYNLEPLGENRYHLVYLVKEALPHTLGASLRYDSDHDFVALAEFTARQLFHTPSKATISSQFGGIEDYIAALRFIPPSAQFFFIEPKVEVSRLERQDIRNQNLVDKFTDKREGGQLMIGASIFKQLDIAGGYRFERARISGGSEPNRTTDSTALAGLSFHLNRDSLDHQEFPHSGMTLSINVDKQSKSLGGDFEYSRWQADYHHYFSTSPKSTFQINASAGYSHGPAPFYDLFFIGGYSLSERASRPFLGLERDELPARQMAILGASYRRQIFSRPLSLVKRGFLTATYNGVFYSSRQASPYQFSYLNGVGLGLTFDTILGPVRAAGGWGEGGRFHFYLSLGPAF
jgi:NTE family protein